MKSSAKLASTCDTGGSMSKRKPNPTPHAPDTIQGRIAKLKQDREAKAEVVNKILAGPSKKTR